MKRFLTCVVVALAMLCSYGCEDTATKYEIYKLDMPDGPQKWVITDSFGINGAFVYFKDENGNNLWLSGNIAIKSFEESNGNK